jgi:hypothetical protein
MYVLFPSWAHIYLIIGSWDVEEARIYIMEFNYSDNANNHIKNVMWNTICQRNIQCAAA